MQPTNTRLHSFVHALQAVYSKWLYSMLSIATVAMAMVLLQEERIIDATDVLKIIQGLVAASSVAGLLGGYRRYQSAISSLRTAWTADEKERRYRRALTSWWATNALPGILSLTGFCLTGQYALFLLGLFHTAIHFMFAPRLPVIEMLLHVSGSEREPARQGASNEITDQ